VDWNLSTLGPLPSVTNVCFSGINAGAAALKIPLSAD
jgi:hypothetical protein